MPYSRIRNTPQYKALVEEIQKHDVISFDVFDTLIHRLVSKPRAVFSLIEAQLRDTPYVKDYPVLGVAFAVNRRQAERIARAEREKEENDTEVTFDEIYSVLQEMLGLPQKIVEYVKILEIQMELKVLYADPIMLEVFNYARKQHKKIIICSDMYLPKKHISLLLAKCGYKLSGVEIFVSCDFRKSKFRGDLFDMLPRFRRSLHIGDNEHSDVEMAQNAGFDAYHYNFEFPESYSFEDSTTQHIINGILAKVLLDQDLTPTELLGAQIYGPLATGFLIWLFTKLRSKQYDRLLFFARDGAVFYDLLKGHFKDMELVTERLFTNLPLTEYVHVSRTSMTLPSLLEIDIQKAHRMVSGKEPRPVREWLSLYGLTNTDLYVPVITSCGFSSADECIAGGDPRVPALLQKLYLQILTAAANARLEAQDYLRKYHSKKLAVVDLGWLGSVQQNFTKILCSIDNDVQVDGYYFNLWTHNSYSRASLHDSYSAYIWDHANEMTMNIPQLLQEGGVELLEDVLSATEGTTLGYIDGEPILEESTTPDDTILQLQKGCKLFFETAIPLLKGFLMTSLDSLDWVKPFFRVVEFPTAKEAEVLGEIKHTGGAGETGRVAVPLAGKVSDVNEYEAAGDAAYWKQGFKLRNSGMEEVESESKRTLLSFLYKKKD